MSTPDNSALQQALQLAQSPELRLLMQKAPLPPGMSELIRLISDEAGKRNALAQAAGLSTDAFQQQLVDYYFAVCMYPGSSPERILALNPACDLRQAKEHHRLLVKWLHPDRNPGQAGLAEQVNRAWQQCKEGRQAAHPLVAAGALEPGLTDWQPRAAPVAKSRFPLFLGMLAVAGLVLLLLASLPDREIYSDADPLTVKTDETHASAAPKEVPVEWRESMTGDWAAQEQSKAAELPAAIQASAPLPKPVEALPAAMPLQTKPTLSASQKLQSPAASPVANTAARAEGVIALARSETPKPVQPEVISAPAGLPPATVLLPERQPTALLTVSQPEATALLQRFQQHYSQGDTQAFMRLFSSDARNNRGDRAAIQADYTRLFEASFLREVRFSKMQWQHTSEGLQVNVRFVSRVQRDSDRVPVKNKGQLLLAFTRESGQPCIQRIVLSP